MRTMKKFEKRLSSELSEVADISRKTTTAPSDWGNYIFPEGCSTLQEVEEWLDENCSNGHFSEWTSFGTSIYWECRRQLETER